MNDHPPVPRSFDQVTPEWLTAVLRRTHPGIKVTSAKVDPTMGHKPNKARVHLAYDAAGEQAGLPPTLVVKGTFNGTTSRGRIIDFSNMAELVSYRDILPRLTVNVPRLLYQTWEAEPSEAVVLLFEDMATREPTYFPTAFNTLDYGQAARFLTAMARFHAESWNSPAFAPGGEWGPGTPAGENAARIRSDYFDILPRSEHWQTSVVSPRGAAMPRKLRDPDRMEAGWLRLVARLEAHAKVIVHGDEHLGNLFVEPDGTPGLYDFLARGEAWPLGLVRFLIPALDILDRRAWERALLAGYLADLRRFGVEPPGFEEAWLVYRASAICTLMIWLNNSSTWQPEATNTANAARAAAAVMDHDSFGLLGL
ncbi:phosphotransferase [Sphingomonas profundi]|uniref:phosphotransferase n=1 Tax=Alterirhizorhabdus profundi TaxID=2681549 RepID=UPI0018D13C15|nr:phosphotransferase [Sphingomonas profundi]